MNYGICINAFNAALNILNGVNINQREFGKRTHTHTVAQLCCYNGWKAKNSLWSELKPITCVAYTCSSWHTKHDILRCTTVCSISFYAQRLKFNYKHNLLTNFWIVCALQSTHFTTELHSHESLHNIVCTNSNVIASYWSSINRQTFYSQRLIDLIESAFLINIMFSWKNNKPHLRSTIDRLLQFINHFSFRNIATAQSHVWIVHIFVIACAIFGNFRCAYISTKWKLEWKLKCERKSLTQHEKKIQIQRHPNRLHKQNSSFRHWFWWFHIAWIVLRKKICKTKATPRIRETDSIIVINISN